MPWLSFRLNTARPAKSAANRRCTLLVVRPNIVVNPSALRPIHDFDPVMVDVTSTVILSVHDKVIA
jgi:hypothetical protein